jgi:hypothetical protein
MPRTIFHSRPVNKPYNLPNSINFAHNISLNDIQIRVNQKIDRIQLSVDSRAWDLCCEIFDDLFTVAQVNISDKNKIIRKYEVHNSTVQLVKYPSKFDYSTMWFSLVIHDPSLLAQEKVLSIISEIMKTVGCGQESVSLSQVEIALDFCPINYKDYDNMQYLLTKSVNLNYSRSKSHRQYLTTKYIGLNGNIRNGSKGLRCYSKGDRIKFYRIELQLNRKHLREHSINFNCLPIYANVVDPFKYVKLYKQISNANINKLAKKITSERQRKSPKPFSKMAFMVYLNVVRSEIIAGVSGINSAYYEDNDMQVFDQMDFISKIHSKYDIRFKKDRLFHAQRIMTY